MMEPPAKRRCAAATLDRVVDAASAALLPFLLPRDATALRTAGTAWRAAVAESRWACEHHVTVPDAVLYTEYTSRPCDREGCLSYQRLPALAAAFPHATAVTLCHDKARLADCQGAAAQCLQSLPRLRALHVARYGIAVARACLQWTPQLTVLSLMECVDSSRPGNRRMCIGDALRSVPQLRELSIIHCGMDSDGARTLAQELAHVPLLTKLVVRSSSLGDGGGAHLAAGLAHTPLLTHLALTHGGIGNAGACAVAAALHHLPALVALDLDHNCLDNGAFTDIADALVHTPRLTHLRLSHNKVDANGMYAFATRGLRHVPNLQVLSVQCRDIGDGGVCAVSAGLKRTPHLTELYTYAFGGASWLALAMAAETLPLLQVVGIHDPPVPWFFEARIRHRRLEQRVLYQALPRTCRVERE